MISTKPYLIRGIREWALDNGLTPQILVDAHAEGVDVPAAYVKDGRITLNIDDKAISDAEFGNEWLLFGTRFQGHHVGVEIPVTAVVAVFARENGQGVVFKDDDPTTPNAPQEGQPRPGKKKAAHLKIVK